jgi:hypothetical protein
MLLGWNLGWTLSDVLLCESEHVWQADAIVAVGLRVRVHQHHRAVLQHQKNKNFKYRIEIWGCCKKKFSCPPSFFSYRVSSHGRVAQQIYLLLKSFRIFLIESKNRFLNFDIYETPVVRSDASLFNRGPILSPWRYDNQTQEPAQDKTDLTDSSTIGGIRIRQE